MTAMLASDLPLPRIGRGKVRDIYAVGDDRVLLLTTDRISAFDVVMAETIPMKGAVLTQISAWWFDQLEGVVHHHMISADADTIIGEVPALQGHRASLAGRAMLCKRTTVFPIECVVRGYLSGSAWKEYAQQGTLAGEKLPPGLLESAKLEPPIFSPATKAETGHDENITIARMREVLGDDVAATLERMARTVYEFGERTARKQGIIIADTKFEFGRDKDGRIILIDEVMTPDSSRFWAADAYKPGQPQPSFDKQPLRDYLDAERRAGRWNGDAPPPPLPASVVDATSRRYLEAYRRVTGASSPSEPVIARSSCDEAIPLLRLGEGGLLRFARNDVDRPGDCSAAGSDAKLRDNANATGAPHDRCRCSSGRTRWTGDHRLHQSPALP
jgi:phosphoribosylaminoimidazole-succinocarboxamide synthase